jgi:UPF0755 protein
LGKYKHDASNKNKSYLGGNTEIFDKNTLSGEYPEYGVSRRSMKDSTFWRFLRPFLIVVISLALVAVAVVIGYNYVNNHYLTPVDANSTQKITVEIKKGSSVTTIAELLYKSGLIKNKTVFKFYVDFSDMTSKLKAGTFTLSKDMTMDDIMYALSKGDNKPKVTKFTVTEGMTVEEMANSLFIKGVIKDKEGFLKLCKDGTAFFGYSFIADLDPSAQEQEEVNSEETAQANKKEDKKNSKTQTPKTTNTTVKGKRIYLMEGYLFPDTYEIFTDASNDVIIKKMLDRFSQIFNETYVERADDLGYTIDQIVTMASIIEREGKSQDFKKISAVFRNRLKKGMPLGSDATLRYIYKKDKFTFTEDERLRDSPYNTYKIKGLPIGAISNPGKDSIEAALYPDEQYLDDNYLYFCSGMPESGVLIFSKTKAEHDKQVAKYKPYWDAYDKKNAG